MYNWIALVVAVFANVVCNLCLKHAMQRTSPGISVTTLLEFVQQPLAWLGIVAGVVLLASYLVAIKGISLSVAYPSVTGLGMAALYCANVLMFAEPFQWQRLTGVLLVAAGAFLLFRST